MAVFRTIVRATFLVRAKDLAIKTMSYVKQVVCKAGESDVRSNVSVQHPTASIWTTGIRACNYPKTDLSEEWAVGPPTVWRMAESPRGRKGNRGEVDLSRATLANKTR